jgi:hypothetical protein
MKRGILVVERHHRIATVEISVNSGIIHDRDIQPAIVVTIKQGDATAHGFNEIVLVERCVWNGSEASVRANIVKIYWRRLTRWCHRQQQRGHETGKERLTG